jgi:hypothetical protein
MADAEHYRGEARRCRELAASAPNRKSAQRWKDLADEYTILAEELEAAAGKRTPILRRPTQRQPVQQQQSKKEDTD